MCIANLILLLLRSVHSFSLHFEMVQCFPVHDYFEYSHRTCCCTDSRRHIIKRYIVKFSNIFFWARADMCCYRHVHFHSFWRDATFTRARFYAFSLTLQPLIIVILHHMKMHIQIHMFMLISFLSMPNVWRIKTFVTSYMNRAVQ